MDNILKYYHQKPQISESSISEGNKSNLVDNTSMAVLTHANNEHTFAESMSLLNKQTNNANTDDNEEVASQFPRFTIIHNAETEKKHLENHSFEDYFFYDIVDEKSFQGFNRLTLNFVIKRLNDKTTRLYSSLRRQIADTVQHGIKQVHTYPDLILKVINKTLNQKVKKVSLCGKLCKCCSKPKELSALENEHNMKSVSDTIDAEVSNFIKVSIEKLNENALEMIKPVNKEEVESFVKKKSNVFFLKKGMEERLREEADNYSKYFNINKVIEKHTYTLESQKEKMAKIHEIKELNECIICMEKQRNVIFIPCYHLICCQNCGLTNVSDECPECKTKIEKKLISN